MVSITPPSSPGKPHAAPPQRQQTLYHPVVSMMVSGGTMRDCYQVKELYNQCTSFYDHAADGEPFVCRTAKQYHAQCLNGEKL